MLVFRDRFVLKGNPLGHLMTMGGPHLPRESRDFGAGKPKSQSSVTIYTYTIGRPTATNKVVFSCISV